LALLATLDIDCMADDLIVYATFGNASLGLLEDGASDTVTARSLARQRDPLHRRAPAPGSSV
jgi:hypothetical protein